MAELVYDENGRLLFTKEMKEEYTILFPTMLPVHFGLMARILETEGYPGGDAHHQPPGHRG